MFEGSIPGIPRFPSANARLAPAWVAKGILPENIECSESGSAAIALEPEWISLMASLQGFSPVLSITRNSHAIIGHKGALPDLQLSDEEGTGANDCDGAYDYEFPYWASARIVFPQEDCRSFPAVEFVDGHGDIHHKICLYEENALAKILAWTKCHQQKEAHPFREARQDYYIGRIDQESSRAILKSRRFLATLIEDAVATQQNMRVIAGNNATVQGHVFYPQELRRSGQWVFLSDTRNALHLRIENLAEICITPDSFDSSLVVKAYEPEGHLVCVFCAPPNSALEDWNHFVHRNLEND